MPDQIYNTSNVFIDIIVICIDDICISINIVFIEFIFINNISDRIYVSHAN